MQSIAYIKLNSVKRALTGNFNKSIFKTTEDYLFGSYWFVTTSHDRLCIWRAFNGNILMVGKATCGKETFAQKLGINNFFSKLLNVYPTEAASRSEVCNFIKRDSATGVYL